MTLAYIAVGSNLGNREDLLIQARQLLSALEKVQFVAGSKIYETDPVGGPSQGKYLNAVWEIETTLPAKQLLEALLEIEKKLGRVRSERNAARTIDLDILFYNETTIDEPGMTIPHPRLHEREFVLKPLMDLCPEWVHPRLKKTVKELYEKNH